MRRRTQRFQGIAFAAFVVLTIPVVGVHDFATGPETKEAVIQSSNQVIASTTTYQDTEAAHRGARSTSQPDAKQFSSSQTAATSSVGIQTSSAVRWVSTPFSGPIANPPISNFGVVEEGILYRSAQPDDKQYQWLLDQGFKSIVSFRRETGDTTDGSLDLGFQNYLWLSVEDETNPSDEQALQFLDFTMDSRNWPILIHCKVGLGRTGVMAALVRYAVDGWSMDDAIMEAKLYRGGVDLVPSQTAWLRAWEARHAPSSHRPEQP